MIRKLFTLLCIASATCAIAQPRTEPVKTTENQGEAKIDYKKTGSPMPSLILISADDSAKMIEKHIKPYMTNDDFDNNANLFVMMFNPTCSHCQNATQMLEKNISMFRKSKIVLVANKGMRTYLPEFIGQFNVRDYPVMSVGIDSTNFIDNIYLYGALPQIDIYDKHRKLLKIFAGDVAIDSLKQYIQ